MPLDVAGLIVPVVVLAGVVVVVVLYFRRLPLRRADLRRRQATGEVPHETKAHLAMRLALAAIFLALFIVGTIVLVLRG